MNPRFPLLLAIVALLALYGFPLRAGEPVCGGGEHKITSILILARDHTLAKDNNPITVYVGQRLPLQIEACWAIPYVEDVTEGARLTVDDPACAEVDDHGVLIAKAPGKVVVTARYAGFQDRIEITIVNGPEPAAK